jgi:hypothetical protein
MDNLRFKTFATKWERLLLYLRICGSAVFIPLMILGFALFPDFRVVTSFAVVVLSIVIYRGVRKLRSLG